MLARGGAGTVPSHGGRRQRKAAVTGRGGARGNACRWLCVALAARISESLAPDLDRCGGSGWGPGEPHPLAKRVCRRGTSVDVGQCGRTYARMSLLAL